MYKRFTIYVAIVVSVVGCGDNAATKAENEALKARLERLEASQPSGASKTEQSSVQPESVVSPEDVVRRYYGAEIWQERLPFVAYPDKVEARMREHYAATPLGQGKRAPTIHRAQEQSSGKWHVPLSVDGVQYGLMVVIKTKDGNKVDWEATIRNADVAAMDAQRRYIAKWGLENAKVEVKVLKVHQEVSYTVMDIEVRNSSSAFIDYWQIDAAIYGTGDKYLGKGFANGNNLQAGDTAIDSINFSDVNVAIVKSWKLKLGRINLSNDSGENVTATRHFSIIVQ